MSCGYIALKQMGIIPQYYAAYEIDKYAVKVSKHNFPDIIQCGDVFQADFKEHGDIDLLIGGSPCTYWSIAQNSNSRETAPRGIGWNLFQQYVRAIEEVKPDYFVYENNYSMSNEIKSEINNTFGFEPYFINSALVSAQNRKRLYWVGIKQTDGKYIRAEITQPINKNIRLLDILEDGVTDREKSLTLAVRYEGNITSNPEYNIRRYTTKKFAQIAFNPVVDDQPKRVGTFPRKDGVCIGSQANRIYSVEGKSVCIKANAGGQGAKTGLYAISGGAYNVTGNLMTVNGKTYPLCLPDGNYSIRKLSVNECKKLQTVPDWYDMSVISDSQSYKCLGNGWTVDVITHILKSLFNQYY